MRTTSGRLLGRLAGGVVVAAIGYVCAIWLDFDPQPLPYVVWAAIAIAMVFLAVDSVDAPIAYWQSPVQPRQDRTGEVTSDLRVLTSNQQADHPSQALADRLVALARGRDPALADELRRELAGTSRIAPADIDRILTRIEESRDRR
ncbi:hypothetical protein L2K70_19675 [Nocardioides KLBMP 9356]|uniref:Uncharacterized protein n=1 Tax=Nocardioides potassii TaxID=2911371 RepID=A0ABS9HGZ2_9ACTN|nr:hypothetical protein [Nocardioides potassii]MCF6379839.1 hypothetical protein [Nocardioides potassii]